MSDNGLLRSGPYQKPPESDGGVKLCAACARRGQCRMGMVHERLGDDNVLRAQVSCSAEHEGGPNVAHGGWTAGIMDEVLGHLPIHMRILSVTGTLEIKFIRPVPIERELVATAWLERREGQRLYVSGELRMAATNAELAAARGIFVMRDRTHFDRQQAWLAQQDAEQQDAAEPAPNA